MNESPQFEKTAAHNERLRQKGRAGFRAAQRSDQLSEVVGPQRNRLLKTLQRDAENRLFSSLKLVSIRRDSIIQESGQPLPLVFFPIDSIVSLLCVSECGSTVEVAMVGNEGLVGLTAILGGKTSAVRARVWRAGYAYVLPADRLGEQFEKNCEVRMLLLRYTQSLFTEMAQTAFCNRHHSICQQFCRWLLMSMDRHPSSELDVTQEMIANTLGVRAASISEVVCKLQKLRVIDHHRGRVTVLDRLKLERIACDCYATVKNDADSPDGSLRPMTLTD